MASVTGHKGRVQFGWSFEPTPPYRLKVDYGDQGRGYTKPRGSMAEAFSLALGHARFGAVVTIINHYDGLEPVSGMAQFD